MYQSAVVLLIARQISTTTVDKLHLFAVLIFARKGVIGLETKDNNSNTLAVKFLGAALIVLIIGFFMYLSVTAGYNTYLSFSKEKIEVRAENSNSTDKR